MKFKLSFLYSFFALSILFSQTARTNSSPAVPSAKSMMAGSFIDVNSNGYPQSNYNIQQIIENVLITGGANCTASVSNVIVSPNISAGNSNRSWGYFNKGTTNFPFNDGIVLMTGPANTAGNAFIAAPLAGTISQDGDADLAAALGLSVTSLKDATFIQFDFVPVTNELSFQYIFASEEYQENFPCSYTDGFALLIKKVTDPSYTNIAVLPAGGGPVSVSNIHPNISSACPAVNQQYFAGYNTGNIETNFAGKTIPLTATAAVTPGETYRFKIVLADEDDQSHDTGVFLKAGSFNIGVQLSDSFGNNLPESLNICEGSSQVLNAAVPIPGASYQWFLNNNPISGANSATYTATQSGVYSVKVTIPGTTCPGEAQININILPLPQTQNSSLAICSPTTTGIFDLTSSQAAISTTPGVTFSYYTTLADATAGNNNNNNITNPSSYNSVAATIYVRVSSGECSKIAELELIVNQTPPTPTITASSTVICGNESITLTSSATTGNTWSTGETTQTITVTTPGTYTLTHTNGNCTSDPASVTITGNENPNVQITGNNYFCTGSSTTLTTTATGTGNTFLWSTGATTPSITVSTAGTYTVTVTTPGGCEFQGSISITENPVPEVQNITLNECSVNGTFTFDLTSNQQNISSAPGVTFTYYTNLADANAGNTNNITSPTAYNTNSSTIYVRVSNGNCFAIAQIQINVGTTPVPVISQSAPAICGNTPVVLTSNYSSGNTWSTGATTESITINTPGTYTLTVTNGNCVSEQISITIEQNDDPNLSISGNLSFCQGSSTTLTANVTGTGHSFLWSNGATSQSTTVNTAGTYSVTVTTSGGCQYNASANVTIDAPIEISIVQPQQITCTNPTVTINASGSTFTSGANILWTASAGGNIVSGANTLTPVVNEGGNYTLTITNNFGLNCSQSQTVTVIENNLPPVISLTASDVNICEGESVTLTANGANTYTWNGLTGNGNTQIVSPTTTTTYSVTGVGLNGCAGNTATITINVVPAITSTLKDVHFCKGTTGVLDAGSGSGYTYLWNTGETTQTITIDTPGEYSVTINNGVCSKTFTAIASHTPLPVVKEVVYENNTLTIIVEGSNANLEYSLDNGVTWQSSNIFGNILKNTSYTIYVREKGVECWSIFEYLTFTIGNAITPNGDGINDYLDFTAISKYKNFEANIYDRYGKEVFRATPQKTIWNGTYTNYKVTTDTYWYKITWTDPISNKTILRSGWVLVKNRE